MNLDGRAGPIGYLNNTENLLRDLKTKIESNSLPAIICKKPSCWCGLCAPKAKNEDEYNLLIKNYRI
jgi:hypothetical protein